MNYRAMPVLIACFGTIFTSYAIRYAFGVLLPKMLPSLAISKTQAGIIFTSYFVTYTIFSPILGLLADRYNVRVLLTLFPFVLGIGTFLMSYSSSPVGASLFFAIAGIGAAACWAPVMALAQRWVSDRRRGMALALIDVGSALGIVTCSAVVPLMVVSFDWRTGWETLGVLAFVVASANFFLVKGHPVEKSTPGQLKQERKVREPISITYIRLLRDLKFWFLAFSYLLIGFSILIPFTFVSTYAVQELMLPYEIAARLITVIGVAAVLGKLVLGTLSDRTGRIKMMMLCSILIAAGCLGLACSQWLVTLIIFAIIFGLGYGAVWPLYAACASDYFAKEFSGSVIGLWVLFLGVGSIISPIVAGRMGDTTGTLNWSFIVAMAGALVALLLQVATWLLSSSSSPLNR